MEPQAESAPAEDEEKLKRKRALAADRARRFRARRRGEPVPTFRGGRHKSLKPEDFTGSTVSLVAAQAGGALWRVDGADGSFRALPTITLEESRNFIRRAFMNGAAIGLLTSETNLKEALSLLLLAASLQPLTAPPDEYGNWGLHSLLFAIALSLLPEYCVVPGAVGLQVRHSHEPALLKQAEQAMARWLQGASLDAHGGLNITRPDGVEGQLAFIYNNDDDGDAGRGPR